MFFSGNHGQLLINGHKAARVQNWSFSSSVGLLDTTSLEDTDKTSTPGVRSLTGSCSLFYYAPDPGSTEGNSASTLLNLLIKSKTSGGTAGQAAETEAVRLRLKVDDATVDGKFIEVDAYLTSVAMTMAVGQVLSAEVAWEAVGAPVGVNL